MVSEEEETLWLNICFQMEGSDVWGRKTCLSQSLQEASVLALLNCRQPSLPAFTGSPSGNMHLLWPKEL